MRSQFAASIVASAFALCSTEAVAQVTPDFRTCTASAEQVIVARVSAVSVAAVHFRIEHVLQGAAQSGSLQLPRVRPTDSCFDYSPLQPAIGDRIVIYRKSINGERVVILWASAETIFDLDRRFAEAFPEVKRSRIEAYRSKAKSFNGAIPRGNPEHWITDRDYPPSFSREGVKGLVRVRLTVAPSGVPTSCVIVHSTGNADLDAATCRALISHARYKAPLEEVRLLIEHVWQ